MTASASLSSSYQALNGCRVVVTRPRSSAGPLVRALRQRGADVLRLPAQSVVANAAFDWPAALTQRAGIDGWIFTSPAAVDHAGPLLAAGLGDTPAYAVGKETAAALGRQGAVAVAPLQRQDSEGLLALAELASVSGRRIAVVGAPGGRGLIATELSQRGARVEAWPVYRRERPSWRATELAAIASAAAPLLVVISSTDSIENLSAGLPPDLWQHLQAADWIASSERIAAALHAAGVAKFTVAASAGTADLVAAAVTACRR